MLGRAPSAPHNQFSLWSVSLSLSLSLSLWLALWLSKLSAALSSLSGWLSGCQSVCPTSASRLHFRSFSLFPCVLLSVSLCRCVVTIYQQYYSNL